MDGTKLKVIAYADDINFFVTSQNEMNTIMITIKGYGKLSGAIINKQKTVILVMRRIKGKN